MFTIQITSIDSRRQSILAQIEELSRQEQALVQESLQYREMEDEAGSLLGAIASLKTKFSQHENATSALFAEISKLFQPEEPPTEPEPEEKDTLVEDEEDEEPALKETATTSSNFYDSQDHLAVCKVEKDGYEGENKDPVPVESTTALDQAPNIVKHYESAQEIQEALADTGELDIHLMEIASILDSCPAIEIPGRVWFYIQNIPAEFDDRILGYLPKSIRPEWDKQRTAYEEEMKASILPSPIAVRPASDISRAEIREIAQDISICETWAQIRKYLEGYAPATKYEIINEARQTLEKLPHLIAEYAQATDDDSDFYWLPANIERAVEEILHERFASQEWVNLVDDDGEEDSEQYYDEYSLLESDRADSIEEAVSEVFDSVAEQEENFSVDDIVQIPGGAIATIQSVDFIGAIASYTLRMPNGKNQSGFKAYELKKMGKFEKPADAESEMICKVGSLVKVSDGRMGQVIYFSTTLMGEESIAVEFTAPKGKKKTTEYFTAGNVTVVEGEPETISIPKDKNIGRWCDCPDGRTGRIIKTTKKGRSVEAEVQFYEGSTNIYDMNSLWLLPHDELIDSKVMTPDGGIGIVWMIEPTNAKKLVVRFQKGSAPYFKEDLVLALDDQELTALPSPRAA